MAKLSKHFAAGLLMVGLVVSALTACTVNGEAEIEATAQEVQTSVVRRGDITISATGAGNVIATTDISLGFPSGGTLAKLRVKVGDEVAAGDELAVLDSNDAQQSVTQSELQLAQTELQTDAAATQTGISFNDIAIEQALMTLEQAQAQLDELLNWQPDEAEIALAQAQLDAAQANYQAALGQSAATDNNLQVAAINLEQVKRSLADAQAAYNTAFDPGRDWELNDPRRATQLENERDAAASALQRAQDNMAIARLEYDGAVASSASGSVAGALSSVLSAEQALVAAQTSPTDDEIEAARIAVRQADLAYKQALLNEEADDLSLLQAQLDLESARQILADTTLIAPMAGIITAINASPGETVSGAFITIADLAQPLLEVYVDETDLDKVAVGYNVDVVFDAFPDETFSGKVVQVDPSITSTGGVSAVRTLVQLDYNRPQTLPIGLNATVDIIGGEALDALIVPVEALREITPGEYVVFIMRDGEPVLTPVEVGLTNFAFAEIKSGLQMGDVVTTGLVATQ
jgi:RND family efflux transporter MFP subunit